jgi:hypothetical protein
MDFGLASFVAIVIGIILGVRFYDHGALRYVVFVGGIVVIAVAFMLALGSIESGWPYTVHFAIGIGMLGFGIGAEAKERLS